MNSTIFIDSPESFSFRATVYSHGWCNLKPFTLDEENYGLSYVFSTGAGPVGATVCEEDGRLRIDLDTKTAETDTILRQIRHILRLDDDLSEFYATIGGNERLKWVSERRAGRLLRSPTVFEDLVKTICTTNCSWGLTKSMVSNLVEKLGVSGFRLPPSGGQSSGKGPLINSEESRLTAGPKAFPTAEAMAAVDADFYRNEIRAGYRSPYFVELAEAVASGRLDPETWLVSGLPTSELRKEMKKVKGVGDYAAENLLKLVGRYDGLALDSWLRSQFYKNHNNEKVCPDKKIARHYSKYGKWRGLVIWCDMTEKWIA